MKVAIFGKIFNDNLHQIISNLMYKLYEHNVELYVYQPFYNYLVTEKKFKITTCGFFTCNADLPKDIDFLISIGGDGTFLETITLVHDSDIPIVGFNSGRLGFLANISSTEMDVALDNLLSKNYAIEKRSILRVSATNQIFGDFPCALNECTIQKTSSSLLTIHVKINGEFLTSYWADGLIIATPTGSTAYSLSVGGPIVTPESQNFIITPIAAHNLNVRPLIIPDSAVLKLSVEGRTNNFLTTIDSRSEIIGIENEIIISKASFSINMIKLPHINFYSTLSNKLMWGADKRN